MALCSECNGKKTVKDYRACTTCKGRGFIKVDGKLVNCTAGCDWGQVYVGDVTCTNCRGTGNEPGT
jgi:DnaJ-class molecular chaperone